MMKKSGTGKKKIEIEKIRRDDYLHATFSKRRAGLFKKANEICTLCDAETALIVFSPAGKAFTFGHPSVDTVINRFLHKETPPADNNILPSAESHQSASVPSVDIVVDQFLPKETLPVDNNVLPSAESHQSASVPSVDTVVDRFLPKETLPVDNNVLPSAESHQSASVPSVDIVVDRFLPKETPPADDNVLPSAESHQSASVPSVDTVVDRFLPKETPPADNNVLPSAESHQSACVPELNGQYSELLDQLEAEKKKRVELKKKNKACEEQYWWNAPIETLSLDELEKLWMSMEQLKKSAVDKPANRLMNGSSSGGTPQVDPPPNNQINPPLNQTNASNNLLEDFNFDFDLDFGSL